MSFGALWFLPGPLCVAILYLGFRRVLTAASEKLVRIIIHMVLNDDFYDWIRGLNLLIIIQMMHAFILRYPHSS